MKGQTTIEFLLVTLIALVYLQAVVQPGILQSTGSLEDVQRITQAKIEAQKIANAIEEISLINGSAKKEVMLLVPKKTEIGLTDTANIKVKILGLTQSFSKSWTNVNCNKLECNFNVPYYKAGLQMKGLQQISNQNDKTQAYSLIFEKKCAAQCEINVNNK